ncbi:hypothetical protein Tco_0579113, partial [Tanacetum coccineum]
MFILKLPQKKAFDLESKFVLVFVEDAKQSGEFHSPFFLCFLGVKMMLCTGLCSDSLRLGGLLLVRRNHLSSVDIVSRMLWTISIAHGLYSKYVPELRRNLISLSTLEKEGFTVKMQSGKIKVIKGSLVVLSGTRRANCLYTLDGHVVTTKTLKGRKQLREYQTGWKIKTGNVLDSCNQRSTQQCTKSGVAKHLGVASGLSKVFWAEDTTMSTYLVTRSPSSSIGFKTPVDMLGGFCWLAIKQGILEPVKVKCIFLGYRKGIVGNNLWRLDDVTSKVLQGVKFEVEPQEDHTFEVEPHGNVDHVVGSQEVQTQDFMDYHSVRGREQHSACELFRYREDSNEATFAVVVVEKINAYETLTFNDTVACEVIPKWNAGLKEDMDARSVVYVLENGYRKSSDDSDGYYWEYTPEKGNVLGMEIFSDQSGNTLRVSQSEFYNKKLVQTLLEGHSILSLEGSIPGDCDVEKNDVGSWKAYVQHMEALSTTKAAHMTLTKAAKEAIWLKGLAIELGFELKIVAGIATGALSKAIPGLRFQH